MAINEQDLILSDEQAPQQSSQEGWLPYLGRQAVSGLEKLPETAFAANELLRSAGQIHPLTRPIFQGVQQIQEAIGVPSAEEFRRGSEKALGYQKGAFNPEGFLENVAQEAIPLAAQTALTSGVGAIPKVWQGILGSAVAGNALENIGDFFGFSEPVKGLLHAGGSLLGSFTGTRSKTIAAKDKNYKKAQTSIPDKATYHSPKGLKESERFLDKIHDLPGYNDMKEDATKFSRLFGNQGNVDIQKAWDFKKRLNELWPAAPRDVRREFIEPMVRTINEDVLLPYGKINKKFGKAFQTAEKDLKALKGGIVTLDKIREYTPEVLRNLEAPKIPKWAQIGAKIAGYGVLPTAGLWFVPAATTIAGGIGLTGRQINRFANLMHKSPTAQKLGKEAVKYLAAGHVSNATRLFAQMGKELEKHDINEEDLILA